MALGMTLLLFNGYTTTTKLATIVIDGGGMKERLMPGPDLSLEEAEGNMVPESWDLVQYKVRGLAPS